MKTLLVTFLAAVCLSGIGSAAALVHVVIGYAERSGPQGDYLLESKDEKNFSLWPISDLPDPPSVPMDQIIPTLEKEFPFLKGLIRVNPITEDAEKLAAEGKVFVFGQVQKPGAQPSDLLGDCVAKAIPAEFASRKRVLVLRKGKSSRYDITVESGAKTELQPGDFVLVPSKMVFGN